MRSKKTICIALFCLACQIKILALDSRLIKLPLTDSMKFFDGLQFTVIGKFHQEKNYARFPGEYKNKVRKEVWELGQNSAGISIRFRTNATDISVNWTAMEELSFPHMAATVVRGVDLYANVNGKWQFIQTGRPKGKSSEYVLLKDGEPVYREYLLNLPLYDGIEKLSIGINLDAEISLPVEQRLVKKKPIVYYGSSIAQGACASRPGMGFTNILSRKLDRAFINMGFSGEGTYDSSVAEAICEVDAALYVIDCNPNTPIQFIHERAVKLVRFIRSKRPDIPILLVENFIKDNDHFMKDQIWNGAGKQKELRNAFYNLKKSGIKNIYYQQGDGLIGNDHEGTVDGVHPNDVGMLRIAEFILPQLKTILDKKAHSTKPVF